MSQDYRLGEMERRLRKLEKEDEASCAGMISSLVSLFVLIAALYYGAKYIKEHPEVLPWKRNEAEIQKLTERLDKLEKK